MDDRLSALARAYQGSRDRALALSNAVHGLYDKYIRKREQSLLDAAATAAAVEAIFLADQIDYSRVTPQMELAFKLQYPHVDFDSLSDRSTEEIRGFLSGWKGKYFEVIACDRLNAGEQVGDVCLDAGQTARLAESAIQPGWDLQITEADGAIAQELQLKATDSLSYVKRALENYPDIGVVVTDEALESADYISDQVFASGISDEDLEAVVKRPMEAVMDTPLENIAEGALSVLPFGIIAVSETHRLIVGRTTLGLAVVRSIERAAKSGAAIGVAKLVVLWGGGLLSIPASFLTRLGFDRFKVADRIVKEIDARTVSIRKLLPVYVGDSVA